jgi:DNA-binding GntR family transcriptional regulator
LRPETKPLEVNAEGAPLTAQQAVLEALRAAIRSGTFPPGAVIRQEALAAEFGLSRVPVREALKFLEGEGTVTYIPHRGFSVVELTDAEVMELLRLREVLSAEAMREAFGKLGPLDLQEISRALKVVEASQEERRLHSLIRELHFAIMRPSRLCKTLRLLGQMWDALDASGHSERFAAADPHAAVSECQQLVEAVFRSDAAAVTEDLERIRLRQGSLITTS